VTGARGVGRNVRSTTETSIRTNPFISTSSVMMANVAATNVLANGFPLTFALASVKMVHMCMLVHSPMNPTRKEADLGA